jgi:hypothetical protein
VKTAVLVPIAALVVAGCPFGLTAGLNWSQFHGSGAISDDTLLGERVGGVFVFGPRKFNFMAELLHVRKGAKNARLTGMATGEQIDIQYFQINYLARMGVGNWLSIFTGPSTAFTIDAEASGPIPGVSSPVTEDDVNSVEAGWVVGLDLTMAIFTLDFRYEFGMNTVFDASSAPDIRNSAMSMNLAVRF